MVSLGLSKAPEVWVIMMHRIISAIGLNEMCLICYYSTWSHSLTFATLNLGAIFHHMKRFVYRMILQRNLNVHNGYHMLLRPRLAPEMLNAGTNSTLMNLYEDPKIFE